MRPSWHRSSQTAQYFCPSGDKEAQNTTGSTIDHLVSVTIFLAAILLFVSFFNQTLQTAILYQRHRNLATNCDGLLENMLLTPGIPSDWGASSIPPTGFGLQDPEFTSYRLSPFALMRLQPSTGTPITYSKTGMTYSNLTMGFGNFLFLPTTQEINYSTASRLLGTRETYGFQLTLTPIITVSVTEVHTENPLSLRVNVYGIGSSLSNAALSYCFLKVFTKGAGLSPSYTISYGANYTDETGSAVLNFQDVDAEDSYALIVYANMSGLTGVGCHERVISDKCYVIPLIDSFEDKRVLLAHSYDVHYLGPPESAVFYNSTFLLLSQDFTLREMPLGNSNGKLVYGEGHPYDTVTIPTYNPGILIISYQSNNDCGISLMPWGINSMAFSVTFGDSPFGKEWVVTNIRQVIVGSVAYQAKLALWSLEGYPVMG